MRRGVILIVLLGWISRVSGVTFTKYTIDEGFSRPHGDWAANIVSTNTWTKDAMGTSGLDGQVYWWQNVGNGTVWGTRNVIHTDTSLIPFEVAAGDFDNDGDVDVVSSFLNLDQNGISKIYLHNATSPGVFSTTQIGSFEGRARQIRVYDINADSKLDIIVASNSQRGYSFQNGIGIYWFQNTGGSNPANFTQNLLIGANVSNPWKTDCFDAEGDGHLEIVATEDFCAPDSTAARLVVYKNNGAEVFTMYVIDDDNTPYDGESRAGPRCKDFDGDGLVDIAAGYQKTSTLYWYKNMDNSGYNFQRYTIDANCPEIDGFCSCDPDGDGDWDIFVAGRSYWFRWYENNGSGSFTSHDIETGFEQTDLPYTTFFDGDTCCDVMISIDNYANSEPGYFFAYLNPCGAGVEEKEYTSTSNWIKVPSIIGGNLADIEYSVDSKGFVRLEVRDIAGRSIKVLNEGENSQPGIYRVVWNLSGEPNGLYLVRLIQENKEAIVKKTILIRK